MGPLNICLVETKTFCHQDLCHQENDSNMELQQSIVEIPFVFWQVSCLQFFCTLQTLVFTSSTRRQHSTHWLSAFGFSSVMFVVHHWRRCFPSSQARTDSLRRIPRERLGQSSRVEVESRWGGRRKGRGGKRGKADRTETGGGRWIHLRRKSFIITHLRGAAKRNITRW